MVLSGLFFAADILLLQLLNPLVNSLGVETTNQGKSLNFGVARGVGSGAYAVAAYLLGIAAAKSGAVSVPVTLVVIYVVFLVVLLLFPFEKRTKTDAEVSAKSSSNPLHFFMKYKRFGAILIGCILLYIGHVLLNNFTFQIVESKGGGSSEMGLAMAISACVELPTMFLFAWLVKKIRCDILFRISGIFLTLKTLGTLLVPSVFSFYVIQILQMAGWALICVAAVYYVNEIMETQDTIKGQAYLTMTYTIGSVLGSLIGGRLIDSSGVNAMLIFATAASFIGMLIILVSATKIKNA
jgi:PPP family 3-phenylpropionic acid transporter